MNKYKCIKCIYFSPTHSTEKIVTEICNKISKQLNIPWEQLNMTFPNERNNTYSFQENEITIVAFPVYEGRVPKIFLKTLEQKIYAENTITIIISVYGNREFDDALLECSDVLNNNGFQVIAAGAFIAEHSIIKEFGTGRPDSTDWENIEKFADCVSDKILSNNFSIPEIRGVRPYRELAAASRAVPKTKDTCNLCKKCISSCPMQAIDHNNPKNISNVCICCHACVKICPQQAKYFDNSRLKEKLDFIIKTFGGRKEPEFFL